MKRRHSVPLAWLKNVKDADSFGELLRNNTQLFTVFRGILDDMYEELERGESSLEDFTPEWAYKQAHRNGQRTTLRRLKELTDFIEG